MEKIYIKKRGFLFNGILLIILLGVIVCAGFLGTVSISFKGILSADTERVIFMLRLKRILLGALVGGMLSVSGVIFQAVLRNPLADPYILGVSSGGGLGVVLATVLGSFFGYSGVFYLPLSGFLGSLMSVFMVKYLAQVEGRIPPQNLLLSGVVVGVILTNILIFIVWLFEDKLLRGIIWWLLGNLEVVENSLLLTSTLIGIFSIGFSFLFSRELNALSLGEEEAISLGIDVEKTKRLLVYVASLLTATAVSLCGIVGFVGLIVPHILRFFSRNEHRLLIPSSFLGGAIFIVISDTLARTILSPIEIPIGIITAFIGGMVFIYLLQKKKKIVFK
ncbi:MAG: iron ABC transporter permease [Candidatus Omnitrophica bacterium]|nr:iron ABC transporter permease [Candidatus Omnitrophota bacterium]MCM8793036.1 iron ABC transporter permease [Candidatus Omnitrophota bacterium]